MYMFHCKYCGYHQECRDSREAADVKRMHKQRGCEMGFIPMKNGTKLWVRDDIAADYRRLVDQVREQQMRMAREAQIRAERASVLTPSAQEEEKLARLIDSSDPNR